MRKFLTGLLAAVLMSGLSVGRCMSEHMPMPYKPISEATMRTASAQMYSKILRSSCLNGWRYTRSGISNGFERHYEELRLSAHSSGYTFIPTVSAEDSLPHVIATHSQIAFDAARRLALPRKFGCFRAYWLDG
ncbi:hypothetical protein [Mesorhizobium sp. 10J20-29]